MDDRKEPAYIGSQNFVTTDIKKKVTFATTIFCRMSNNNMVPHEIYT
jgi:hypothetical protein